MGRGRAEEEVAIWIDGTQVSARAGMSVAAALLAAGVASRRSVTGDPRAPLCGMGICMECCATVDGVAYARTCQMQVRGGMKVVTS